MQRALVPEDHGNHHIRRGLIRAVTVKALSAAHKTRPERMLADAWPGDTGAERFLDLITRAATSPLSTVSAPTLVQQKIRLLLALAPQSAALRLFDLALNADLGTNGSISIPSVAAVPPAAFTAEAAPGPELSLSFGTGTLGPLRKILILAAVTRELENASPEAASAIIGRLLASSAERGIDAFAFDTAAGDATRPAGLLASVTPLSAEAGGGVNAMAADIANLAEAFGTAGLNPDSMVIVGAPGAAVKLRLSASPRFENPILSSAALAADTIAAFVPDTIGVASQGAPEISTGLEVALHMEDSAPLEIASVGSPATIAAPVRSMFQTDCIAIRCRARVDWVLAAAGGAQIINRVSW